MRHSIMPGCICESFSIAGFITICSCSLRFTCGLPGYSDSFMSCGECILRRWCLRTDKGTVDTLTWCRHFVCMTWPRDWADGLRLFGTLYQTVNVLLQFMLRVLRVFAVMSCVNVISLRGCDIHVITVPDLHVHNQCSLVNYSRCSIADVISLLFVKQFLSIVFNSKISLLAQAR